MFGRFGLVSQNVFPNTERSCKRFGEQLKLQGRDVEASARAWHPLAACTVMNVAYC